MKSGHRARAWTTAFLCTWLACSPPPRVVVLALDGADLPRVQELVAAGRLPNFARVIERGAGGRLASIRSDLPFSRKRGAGYWSPVVWTSIATGKAPATHGVIDFLLPAPGAYLLCTADGAREAVVELPANPRALGVRLVVKRGTGWSVRLGEADFALPGPGEVHVPSGPGAAQMRLRSASGAAPLCLGELSLLDANANTLHWLNFVADSQRYTSGWSAPQHGPTTTANTAHRRSRAIWNIASEAGRRVAIVGWRDSWPAEEVSGYFFSDQLGLRFASKLEEPPTEYPRVVLPEHEIERARPLLARYREIDAQADHTLLDVAPCTLEASVAGVARVGYWRDWLRHELALGLWDDDSRIELLAVYFAGLDVFGHMFAAPGQCAVEPPLLDRYYQWVDARVGDWLERIGDDTTLLIVSDHGMTIAGESGAHADNGLVLLAGRDVRGGVTLHGADVLDIAPTLLYLLGVELADDMPGDVLWEALEPASGPPRRVATHERGAPAPSWAEAEPAAEAELRERLRALGYVE